MNTAFPGILPGGVLDPEMRDPDNLGPRGETLAALEDLQARSADATARFATMTDEATAAFRPTAEHFREFHDRQTAELGEFVLRLGGEVQGTTLRGQIGQATLALRAMVTDIDDHLMGHIRQIEDGLLAAYDRVLQLPLDDETALRIAALRDEIPDLLSRQARLD